MVEPVGASLGVISLATATSGVFVSMLQCFEHMKLGRDFEEDFSKAQARLFALKLQITRWAVSSGDLPDPQTHIGVDQLLEAMRRDIDKVEQRSLKYTKQTTSPATEELPNPSVNNLDEPSEALKGSTSAIIQSRTRGISLGRRTKWAIYDKKLFDQLLDDITTALTALERLAPQLQEHHRPLCEVEAEVMQQGQSQAVMLLLHKACEANNDNLLKEAVLQAMEGSGHSWERTEVSDHVKLDQGDRIAANFNGRVPQGRRGHRYGVTIGKGESKISQGDIYGSVDVSPKLPKTQVVRPVTELKIKDT